MFTNYSRLRMRHESEAYLVGPYCTKIKHLEDDRVNGLGLKLTPAFLRSRVGDSATCSLSPTSKDCVQRAQVPILGSRRAEIP
jgi:hypothetical protein